MGNTELLGRRKRCLASILAASIRGGGVDAFDEEDDPIHEEEDRMDKEDKNSGNVKSVAVSSNKGTSNDNRGKKKDNDRDERYSRQVYALGARAHKLVRSTTAILDGPLGERGKFTVTSLDDVRKERADNFDGLNSDSNNERGDTRCDGIYDRSESPSGLLYEIAKNLALSGVGRIVLLRDDGDPDAGYFDGSLDDLGTAYCRMAVAEIGGGSRHPRQDKRIDSTGEEEMGVSDIEANNVIANSLVNDGALLLSEYILRLNPGVRVNVAPRSKLLRSLCGEEKESDACSDVVDNSDDGGEEFCLGSNPVVVCVDRSTTLQLEMNDACRERCGGAVPFVSVETAGVHAKIFCDFGKKFVVVDEDGESSRSTLLDRVEEISEGGKKENERSNRMFIVHCLEGERHDVSKGDVIELKQKHSEHGQLGNAALLKFQVTSVKSPTCFAVKLWDRESTTDSSSPSSSSPLTSLLEGRARSFSRVKVPKQMSFLSLRDILQPSLSENERESIATYNYCDDEGLFAPSDLEKSFDPLRRSAVMASMLALDAFVKKYGRLPSRCHKQQYKRTDVERFISLAQKMTNDSNDTMNNQERWESLVAEFAQTCRAKFTPVQALSGALGAQEVLKAATGLYNPVRQFLIYDCDEVLRDSSQGEVDNIAPGQSYILGRRASERLSELRLFLVGAGAIGCELLKNLAAMGAGTGTGGCLILTDMDTIEKSNLSRQLLFRDHDVGKFKSLAARSATLRFNPRCRVEAHISRVGDDDDVGAFDDGFWSSGCDIVLNALDNVEARLFVDRQCVAHGLGLVDAGTLGPKGNVQVVIPHKSESYGSSADTPEPDIPVCTLKNFPYEISHTIQWARDLFDGYFSRRPRQANYHVDEMAHSEDLTLFSRNLIQKLGEDAALGMAEELSEDLGFYSTNWDSSDPEYVSAVRRYSLDWAIRQAHNLFYVAMDELIQKHPIDSVEDGSPFWSGTRCMPKPLRFVPLDSGEDEVSAQQVIINERIAEFVRSAARLRMESFLPLGEDDELSSISLEEALVVLEEQATLLYRKKKSKEILHNLSGGGSNSHDHTLSIIVEKLNGAKTGASFLPQLCPTDFKKDDESNGHVAFVTAASNLRATAYGIPPVDAMETRRVAGRIVPAMITTTGLVSALSCLELVKLVKGLPLETYRNAFVNLALPFFAFTAPMPAEEIVGVNGKTHTIWDWVTIRISDKSPQREMTLGRFLKKILKKAECGVGFEVSSLSYGPFMIYANFLHSDDKGLLRTPLLDSVKDAIVSEDGSDDDGRTLIDEDVAEKGKRACVEVIGKQKTMLSKLDRKRFIDFLVTVEDRETGEEFELPPVRLMKEKTPPDAEENSTL